MRRCLSIISLTFLLVATSATFAQTSTKRIARGLNQPVFATHAPGDDGRLFVLEKDTGNIQILDLENETILEDPFLRVSGLRNGGERGLLGMAFHPDYSTNGKFYVYASMPGGSQHHRSQVFEYQVTGDPATSNTADASTQKDVLQFEQPFGNHNGGWIGFDPTASEADRTLLYVATGDGGSGGDPRNNAQDITNNLLGKMLRIDVDGDAFPDDDTSNYSIPSSNPFVGVRGDDEIWAYGLRNPWRNAFDRQTGDLWIGDVGQGELEEIDVLPAGSNGGQNYGWRIMEGTDCFRSGDIPCGDDALIDPVYEYDHGSGPFQGNSVTGGYLYRGPVKEFQGQYIFADFVTDEIWSFDPHSQTVADRKSDFDADRGTAHSSIASFAEDNQGELYVLGIGGSIYRLESTSRDARWVGADASSGEAGDGATFADAKNWVRDGVADVGFIDGDHLVLGGANLTTSEDLQVSAVSFESDATLSSGRLQSASGNIHVPANVAARVEGRTFATASAESIKKIGDGELEVSVANGRGIFTILDGSVAFQQGGKYDVAVAAGAILDQQGTEDLFLQSLSLEADSVLRLDTATTLTVGDLKQGGTLEVSLDEAFEIPNRGEQSLSQLLVINGNSSGQFQQVLLEGNELGHRGDGQFFSLVRAEATEAYSLLAYNALEGDTDGDGQVDFADFLRLSGAFGKPGDWLAGDFTNDGEVGFDDFLQLSSNFAKSAQPPVAVPEPAAYWVCLMGTVVIAFRQRRKRNDG